MKLITIDQSDFLKGASLTDHFNNGGFSPLSVGIEVDRGSNLGLMSAGRSLTEYSTGLDGSAVTIVKHKLSLSGDMVSYLFCSNSKIYEVGSIPTTFTLKDTASGKTFNGFSDAIIYNNQLYATSTNDIYFDDLTFTSPDKVWWTSTKGKTALTVGVPHKMFEFNGVLYILNGNKIASWDGTTAKNDAFTIPTGYVFTDAEIDNDVIYLTITKSNFDAALYSGDTKILVWNGISPDKWLREINVFTTFISCIKKIDTGFIFFAGNNIYLFDGYNYKYLRFIGIAPNWNTVVVLNGSVYFPVRPDATYAIGCYNPKFGIFTMPVLYNTHFNVLDIALSDFIDIFTSDSKMLRASVNNGTGVSFYSNRFNLINANIRKIIITFSEALATQSSYILRLFDETGNAVLTDTISHAIDGAKSVVFRNNLSVKLNQLQLSLTFSHSANSRVRSIQIFYEPSENYVGK